MQSALKKELEASGFRIAPESTAADAVLAAGFCFPTTVELDGDEWEATYPRTRYCFQLTSANGNHMWDAKIYVSKGQRMEGEVREAALVCVRKLSHAWRKSAHDAGLKTAST